MATLYILSYLSLLTAVIPAIAALVLGRKLVKTLKLLSVFIICNLIIEIVAVVLGMNTINNMFLLHLHTLLEFIFLITIAINFFESKSLKRIILVVSLLYIAFSIWNSFYHEYITGFNSLNRGIAGIIILSIVLLYFYTIFNSQKEIVLQKNPYFWLFSGWLFYFSGTFFLFVYSYQVGLNFTYPIIHSILNIFLNLVYTYVLWLGSRKLIS